MQHILISYKFCLVTSALLAGSRPIVESSSREEPIILANYYKHASEGATRRRSLL